MALRDSHPSVLLKTLEQRARKRFGQHFLHDDGLVDRIVRAARIKPGDRVVEIGPGLGILTRALLRAEADVTAVELDRDLAAWLREQYPEIRLVEGDAMKVDWDEVMPEPEAKVVANLPYNVGTHLLMDLLRRPGRFTSVTVMLQQEVVDRLMAAVGSRAYNALSVEAQVRGQPVFLLRVPPGAFYPPPKVHSAVIRFDLFDAPRTGEVDPAWFDKVVRAGFSHRRKTLANSLGSRFGKDHAKEAIAATGLRPDIRAQALTKPRPRRQRRAAATSTFASRRRACRRRRLKFPCRSSSATRTAIPWPVSRPATSRSSRTKKSTPFSRARSASRPTNESS